MKETDLPRTLGREALKTSVPEQLWKQNTKFSNELVEIAQSHRINHHPVLQLVEGRSLNAEVTRLFHLEAAHAFTQIFTDSLIYAMAGTTELEHRFGPQAKVSARFLLQLNLLDELGFVPGASPEGYKGNPYLAHYIQFIETLRQLDVSSQNLRDYKPSASALACRKTFTDQQKDYVLNITVLAIAETVFTKFAGPWAKSVGRSTSVDVSTGYHKIHVEDHDGNFLDDDHAEDSWYLFRQAADPNRYDEIKDQVLYWLDTWNDFLDNSVHMARQHL